MEWIEEINSEEETIDVDSLTGKVSMDILKGMVFLVENKLINLNDELVEAKLSGSIISALPIIQISLIQSAHADGRPDEEIDRLVNISIIDAVSCLDLVGDSTVTKVITNAFCLGVQFAIDQELR